MIHHKREQLMALKDAAKTLPGRPHVSTIYRWMNKGVDGIQLETVKLGGRRYTSSEAIHRFAQRLTEQVARSEGSPFASDEPDLESRLDEEGI